MYDGNAVHVLREYILVGCSPRGPMRGQMEANMTLLGNAVPSCHVDMYRHVGMDEIIWPNQPVLSLAVIGLWMDEIRQQARGAVMG